MPHEAVTLFVFDFQIAYSRFQYRVPVHQAFTPVDQALFVKLHKGLRHHAGHFWIHREIFMRPADRVAQAPHLAGNHRAGLLFPFPDFFDEKRPAKVMATDRGVLRLQLPLHHDLCGNTGMVGAG